MRKEDQTDQIFLQLYDLTKNFTRALQPRYYYQYTGDIEDLASEFFLQFITPKARKGGTKESLLDKFNPSTTSLAYLVKVCVTRKLIDQSRQNPQQFSSIDEMVEDNGDVITMAFNIVADSGNEESALSDPRFLGKVIDGFRNLPEEERNKHYAAIFDSNSVLAAILQPTIRYVRTYPIQQITDKTVVLYIPEAKAMVNFSLDDGHPRGKFQPFYLNQTELVCLRQFAPYHSQFSRELLIEYLERTNYEAN